MYFEKILQAMQTAAARPHAPAFRLETEGDAWRVFDGDRALALFWPSSLDIWAFSPFTPDERANIEPPGSVIDLHTAHNTCLNFGTQEWPKHWDPAQLRWEWERTAGAELIANVSLAARDGENGRWRLRVSYDPAWGCYRYQVTIDARKLDAEGFEGFNLMLAGALGCRPGERRWTHSLWENADGRLRRIVHSNALFYCTDYNSARDSVGPWRWRHLSYPQAWMSYGAHPSFNPALLIHRTTVPLMSATCSQLFDEHIIWAKAGQDQVGADGYFHWHMDLEFVNLPAPLARELLDQAADPVRPVTWRERKVALPFHMEIENDFERAVDPWLPEECPILVVPQDDRGPIAWADGTAHSGQRSVRLRQDQPGRLALFPTGAVCRVRPQTRYRLSGWVKTQDVAGSARLELAGYAYSYDNISHQAASRDVTGSGEWTRLEVELDSRDQAYLMPYLVLEGSGTAWFDDVRLTAVTG